MSAHGRIGLEVTDGVGRLTIHNPKRRNAMSLTMWNELSAATRELAENPQVRVIVVRGEGREAFCAGADITEFGRNRLSAEAHRAYNAAVSDVVNALTKCKTPTIAMLHGVCMGGGALIASACALRIADRSLRFGIPAAKLGAIYPADTLRPLVHLVGPSIAFEIVASARVLDAEEALAIRLINRVVSEEEIERTIEDYAMMICRRAPLSIRGTWLAIQAALDPSNLALRSDVRELEDAVANSNDYREGVAAFVEKRAPRFTGH